jgi:hypothetical protein
MRINRKMAAGVGATAIGDPWDAASGRRLSIVAIIKSQWMEKPSLSYIR